MNNEAFMSERVSVPAKPQSAWRSPWVLAWLALVLLVLCVNLTMVYFAMTTSPGLVVDNFYDRGQDFENSMVSRQARNPGWTMRADIPGDVTKDKAATVRFFVVDKVGQPVTPDSVTFYAYRPSDAAMDFSVPMTVEPETKGFVADVTFPLFGAWDTLIAVRTGEDEYSVGNRVSVARP